MMPQSSLMVVAPVAAGRLDNLRQLLASMNTRPGIVDPVNNVIPFAQIDTLHFARLLILDDQTLEDIRVYGQQPATYPLYLAFLCDYDGSDQDFLSLLIARAEPGLRALFSHCEGFAAGTNLRAWLQQNTKPPSASYVNWIGRSMRQVREENALRLSLETYLEQQRSAIAAMPPAQAHDVLLAHVRSLQQAGALTLSPEEPTPSAWRLRNLIHLIGVPLVLLILAPILILYAPFYLFQLRRREKSDAEIAPRIVPEHARQLADLEDHDVSNQFSAFGTVKPGAFRLWTLLFFLWAIDYTTRHIFNRGRLARVSTIHFARCVFLDNKKRLFFASNYDGSLDSYMDDFINKVAFGLNLVFSNGIGYPTTNWLILDGAKDELKFKYYIRRHQLPTEVWYNAHPGLTALDLQRNALIRAGLESTSLTRSEIQQWLQLL